MAYLGLRCPHMLEDTFSPGASPKNVNAILFEPVNRLIFPSANITTCCVFSFYFMSSQRIQMFISDYKSNNGLFFMHYLLTRMFEINF